MNDGAGANQAAPAISAVVADVDGTLVTRDKVLTDRAIAAVTRLRERGIVFTICSGRSPQGMRSLVEPLGLTMPMAGFNGGVIFLPDLSVLDARSMPDYVVPAIVEAIEAYGLDVWIYTATDWFVRSADAWRVDREAATCQTQPTVVTTFTGIVGAVKIVGVSHDHDKVAACEVALQQTFGTQVSAGRAQPCYLDVTHPTANKGTIVDRLARYLKIPVEAIATIGDQPTDVLMFKRSGLSVAMGNASADVQKQATHVTTSYDDEGFANAVDRHILPRGREGGSHVLRATAQLHRMGQSLWLDNITRDLLSQGTLQRYIDELSVTGLTSNPTIFERPSRTAPPTTWRSPRNSVRASREKRCSSSSHSRTSPAPLTCSGPFTIGPTAWTDGCRSRCRPCWPTTRRRPSRRPEACSPPPPGRI